MLSPHDDQIPGFLILYSCMVYSTIAIPDMFIILVFFISEDYEDAYRMEKYNKSLQILLRRSQFNVTFLSL